MNQELISYNKKDIIEIYKDLEHIVVILDKMGSHFNEPDQIEVGALVLDLFSLEEKLFQKISNARRILGKSFSREVGEDDMDELERECQSIEYWNIPYDAKKKEIIDKLKMLR